MPDGTAPVPRKPLVEVTGLKMYFPITAGVFRRKVGDVKAVDDVSFTIYEGETLGLVGESGCGKSTCGRAVLRLYDPTAGSIRLNGQEIADAGQGSLRKLRPAMQMVFQDPQASLNPRMTVRDIIGEPLVSFGIASGKQIDERVADLLKLVRLNPDYIGRYPHEFSGGQRQRIGIARALAMNPSFIVCDEPISALDVSIQAQVVNLLEELQAEFGLTYLFIAHDLSMVRHISDRVAVMYLGIIVELTDRNELYRNPLHPYTQALLSAIPIADPVFSAARHRQVLEGDVPSPVNPPSGCRFRTRCPIAGPICAEKQPEWREVGPNHYVACHKV